MFRFLFLFLLLLIGVSGLAWYSAQSLPGWYQAEQSQKEQVSQQLSAQIEQQGVGKFLGGKFADVMRGELRLNETEFNALVLASLNSSEDGRRVLEVSDAVNVDLQNDSLELGMVIDLEKAARLDAKARKAVERLTEALPFLDKSRMFIAVNGRPIARNGELAFSDNFSVTVGAIPISSNILKQLGVPVHRASEKSLKLKLLSVKSVTTTDDEILLGVYPRF